jgi:hypothetical protein
MYMLTTGQLSLGSDQTDLSVMSKTSSQAYFDKLIREWPNTLIKIARKTVFFFVDPGRFDVYEFLDKPHNIRAYELVFGNIKTFIEKLDRIPLVALLFLSILGIFNVLIALGFVFSLFQKSPRPAIKWFMLLIFSYILFAVVMGAFGAARYRIPVEPILLLCSIPVIEEYFSRFFVKQLLNNWWIGRG